MSVAFPSRVPHKYLLPARSLLPFTPLIVVISAAGSTPEFEGGAFVTWMGVHAVTLVAAGLLGMAVSGLLRRLSKASFTLWWVLGMGAFIGALKALGTIWLENILGLADTPPEALIARSLGAIVVGMWLITVFAYGKTALDTLEQARDDVIRRNVATRLVEEVTTPRSEVTHSLAAITQLRDRLTAPDTRVSPDEIRAVVDSTIRPLSRAMWSVENTRYPALKLVALYRIALQSFAMRSWLIAVVWSATTFTALAAPTGITYAATYSGIVGVIAFVLFLVVRLGWTGSVVVSLAVVTLGSVGSVVVGYAATGQLLGVPVSFSDTATLISGVVWMVFIVVGSSIISGVQQLRDVIARDLDTTSTKDLIEQRALDTSQAASTRQVAARLHGSVQSRLLGLAAALDRGVLATGELDQELADIAGELDLLGHTTDTTPEGQNHSAGEALAQLVANWREIVDVTIDPESLATIDTLLTARPESIEVLRESLTNAHRHGLATTAAITAVTEPSGDVTVTVTDNGYGPTNGQAGLGSTLLDALTGSRWSLTPAPRGGSHLRATISPHPHDVTV